MKINTQQVKIGDSYFNLEVHYDKKTKSFFIKTGLPSDFSVFSEKWKVFHGSATEAGLLSHLRESIEQYVANKTCSRKVIVFKAHSSSEIIMNKVGEGHYSGFKKKCLEKLHISGHTEKYELGFDFDVYQEVDSAGAKSYYRHMPDGEISRFPSRIEKTSTVIPYNETYENFFISFAKSFESMVLKISEFFGETDETKIISFIEERNKLIG